MNSQSTENSVGRGRYVLALLVGVVTSLALQVPTLLSVWQSGMLFDSDDAMRLVEVRDFLAGQSWFDLVQHRVDPPAGLLMHWSRFIDAPLAGLMTLLGPLVGVETAERLVRLIWPTILFAGFLGAFLGLSMRISGARALWPAVILSSTALVFGVQFAPGRIDHHSVQMLLAVLVALACSRALEAPRWAWIAGLLGGVLLAIGLEALHVVVLCGVAFGLLWVLCGRSAELVGFALVLAASVAVVFVATIPVDRWFVPACDAISIVLVVTTSGAATLALLLHLAGGWASGWPGRISLAVLGVTVLIGAVALSFPECRGGPYGQIEPLVRELWLSQVREARGIWALREGETGMLISLVGLWGAGALLLLLAAWRLDGAPRRTALLLLSLAAVSMLLAFSQVRAMGYATLFALPGAVWLVTQETERAAWRGALAMLMVLPFTWSIAGLLIGGEGAPMPTNTCLAPDAYQTLAGLPAGRVMAPVDLGSHVLAHTPHSVFGAPYHRNQAGIIAALGSLSSPVAEARVVIRKHRSTYVALCTQGADISGLVAHAPGGLAAQLLAGKAFDWLDPVAGTGPIKVWRVKPD